MCRLFGLSAGEHRVRATCWLLKAPDSLRRQSHANPDGTGLGTFDKHGLPLVEKAPLAAYEDRPFAREARERESATFVAHVRHASTGARTVANTHPFSFDGWIGAHNGVVEGLDLLEEHLGADLAHVRGDTDSERVLALIARESRARGHDLGRGLVAALTWVGEQLPLYAVNLILVTPHELWAVRYPATHELWVLQRPGGVAGPLEHRSRAGTRVRSEHLAALPSVIVASERMDDDPRWRLLQASTVTRVGVDLAVDTVATLLSPRYLLGLAELAPAVAASQHAS